MGIKWIKMEELKPEDDQKCITKMKHGIISGFYTSDQNMFRGYYWADLEWIAYEWAPIEAIDEE